MPKNSSKTNTPTQSQIFELLGRTLYVCNIIEVRLRWMHKRIGGFWAGKTLEELLGKIKKVSEQPQKGDKAPPLALLVWKCLMQFIRLAATKI